MLWFAVLALIIVMVLCVAALRALWRGQWLKSLSHWGAAALLGIIAISTLSLLSNLYTYAIFTQEQAVASVSIHKLKAQDYALNLRLATGNTKTYELHGDIWLLGAQVLVWNHWGQWLGLKSRYRLDRLESLYSDLAQDRNSTHSAYALVKDNAAAWEFWAKIDALRFLVRTVYGSAVYMPLVDGARYDIKLSPTGLIAIPLPSASASY